MRIKNKNPARFAVIGDPIVHSLSPRMHTAAFRKLKLNYQYVPKRVRPNELEWFVKQVKIQKIPAGFNVTLPHKEAIIPLLDGVTPVAARIGAVNTVYWKNGKLWGTNTDAAGFALALKELRVPLRKKTACVLGAGGASRAVVYALGELGFSEIIVVNRHADKADVLVRQINSYFLKSRFIASPWTRSDLVRIFPTVDFIVNTTSIGLQGERFPTLPWERLPKTAIACDLLYRPLVTPFLEPAKLHGLLVQNGIPMFVHQGALAFTTWTKKKAPLSAMRRAVLQAVSKR